MHPSSSSMADASPPTTSPQATPKRKRGQDLPTTPIKFSFDLSAIESPEDGSNSPRSCVAHKFRGLVLGGGEICGGDADETKPTSLTRKRQRSEEMAIDVALEPVFTSSIGPVTPSTRQPAALPKAETPSPSGTESRLVAVTTNASIKDASPDPQHATINHSPTTSRRPRSLNRAGTPPLRFRRSPASNDCHDSDDGMIVVDPVRASLTWHEDEITVYDPDDEDDDGTGINGVGFKPTPALAEARSLKRRQQMAEYRRREEKEARARRSQRRRGEGSSTGVSKRRSPPRKVRFTDADRPNMAATMI